MRSSASWYLEELEDDHLMLRVYVLKKKVIVYLTLNISYLSQIQAPGMSAVM